MLDALARLFEPRAAGPGTEDRDRGLRLCTAALFFEVVRADGAVADEERRALRSAIASTFDLSAPDVEALAREAEETSREAASLYELTQRVDQALPPEDKKRIVELLWWLAFADDHKDPIEEHLVRKVAGLLHVPHADFIDAKIRARGRGSRL
jgi:uncharacterized tellurite resistance protein B-like protein